VRWGTRYRAAVPGRLQRSLPIRSLLLRLAVLAVVPIVGWALAGCCSDPPEAIVPHTPDQLLPGLLTVDDVGADWTQNGRLVIAAPVAPFDEQLDFTPCPKASVPQFTADPQAQVELMGPADGVGRPAWQQAALGATDADVLFDDAVASYTSCLPGGSAADDSSWTGTRVAAARVLGDESATFRMQLTSDVDDNVLTAMVTIARTGTDLVVLRQLDVHPAGTADIALADHERVTAVAIQRIAALAAPSS